MKKAYPSSAKAAPIIGPANSMNRGQSSPISNESAVPETAPTAKRMAAAFAHFRASARYSGRRVRSHSPSAATISSGSPTPSAANTMWNASENAICARAASRPSIPPSSRRPPVDPGPASIRGTLSVLIC